MKSGFSIGHARGVDAASALDAALNELRELDDSHNLGFVYVTDPLAADLEVLITRLRRETPVTHWVGTVGLGVCATGVEYYHEPAVCLLAGAFMPDSFRVFESLDTGLEHFSGQHEAWCQAHHPFFGVVHADPRNPNLQSQLVKLSDKLGSGFLVGGLACASERYAHVADVVEEGGLSGVLFEHTVAVTTRLSQGCSPLGTRHQITAAEHNLIFEIDGRPALDVFKEDIGEEIARDLNKAAGYIFVGLPIEGTDTGDYLVRNLVGIDLERGIIAIGETVQTGQPLIICRRDEQSAVQDLERMLDELLANTKTPVRGGLYTSCIGRGISLFGPGSKELELIERRLGPVPLVGFYANGEVYFNRLYGYTGVLTLFS